MHLTLKKKTSDEKNNQTAAQNGVVNLLKEINNNLKYIADTLSVNQNTSRPLKTKSTQKFISRGNFSEERKFGWDEDYDFNIVYREITGIIIRSSSAQQLKLNFNQDGEPEQKIFCYNPKIFINLLYHFQKEDIIFSDQKLTAIILNRCRNEKGEQLNEGTVNTYLSDSAKLFPYSAVAKILTRIKRTKLRSD
jgi:hypothetical protein